MASGYLNQVGVNIAANIVGKAVAFASIYVFLPYYISLLGVSNYGLIAFYTVMLTITTLADLGLTATFSRQSATNPGADYLLNLMTTLGRIQMVVVGGVSVLLLVFAGFIADHWLNTNNEVSRQTAVDCLRLMAVCLLPQMQINFLSGGLFGLQKQVRANVINSCYNLLRSGAVLLPLSIWPDVRVFFAWQVGVSILFFVISRFALVSALGFGWLSLGRYDFAKLKPILSYSGGMLGLTLISTINTQLDKLIVSSQFSISEFSYYMLAAALAQVPFALTVPIGSAFFPKLTSLAIAGEKQAMAQNYLAFVRTIGVISAVACCGLVLFAPEVLGFWLHGLALPADLTRITVWLTVGTGFLCLAQCPYYLSLAHGETKLPVMLAALTMLISVPLIFAAVSLFGLIGAVVPWVVLNGINLIVFYIKIHRRNYPGSIPRLVLESAVWPVLWSLAAVGSARLLADHFALSPYWACMLAGLFGGLVVCAYLWREYLRKA